MTEDFQELKPLFTCPIQEKYEVIRPLVLFEDPSTYKRSEETGVAAKTVQRQVRHFKKTGMRGLIDQPEGRPLRDLPREVTDAIRTLRITYPFLTIPEIQRTLQNEYGISLKARTLRYLLKREKIPVQEELPFHCPVSFQDTYRLRTEVVKLRYKGWKATSISRYLRVHRRQVHRILEAFEKDHFRGLLPQSRAPKHPARKYFLNILAKILSLQREYPRLGRFRLWGLLRNEMKEQGDPLQVNPTFVKRAMALHRQIYPEFFPAEAKKARKQGLPLLYTPRFRHDAWFIDIRYLPSKQLGYQVYSICILEGYSRTILAGMASPTQDLWAVMWVLYDAIRKFGKPRRIVSDNAKVFGSDSAYGRVLKGLGIEPVYIEQGQPWQNLIEAWFGIQRRMADFKFEQSRTFEQMNEHHAEFLRVYNITDHWALQGRADGKTVPIAVLGWVKGGEVTEEELERRFSRFIFLRKTNRWGYVRLSNWHFYAEEGIPRSWVHILVYKKHLRVEHQEEWLAEYPCNYDDKKRQLKEMGDPQLFETRFRTSQLYLFPREKLGWKKAVHRPRETRSKKGESVGWQLAFFGG